MKRHRHLRLVVLLTLLIPCLPLEAAPGPGGRLTVTFNPYDGVDWGSFQQFRANMHTHTTESGGEHIVAPADVVDYYRAHGFSVLAITEHNKVTWPWEAFGREPASAGMAAVMGSEITSPDHLLSYFNDAASRIGSEDQTLSGISGRGGLAVLAHPSRPGYEGLRDISWYVDLLQRHECIVGMEVINRWLDHMPGEFALWDEVLFRLHPGRPVWAFANDDMHNLGDTGLTWTVFVLPKLSDADVRAAMQAGHLFMSAAREPFASVPVIESIGVRDEGTRIALSVKDDDYTDIRWVGVPMDISQRRETYARLRELALSEAKADFDPNREYAVMSDPLVLQLFDGEWEKAGFKTIEDAVFMLWYNFSLETLHMKNGKVEVNQRSMGAFDAVYDGASALDDDYPRDFQTRVFAHGPEVDLSDLPGACAFLRAEVENRYGTTFTQAFAIGD